VRLPGAPQADSPFWKLWEATIAAPNRIVFRATGGRVGGRFGRAPILLLHHLGRKSGEHRVAPLLYMPDGDRYVIVASKGGVDRNPAWFHNITANPDTEVEVPRRGRVPVRARTATDEERAQLWPRLLEIYPTYAGYQRRTSRVIPLVILEPRPPGA
jgi:deazaflavin-dependent oxidoreductase (nitroreductase family)